MMQIEFRINLGMPANMFKNLNLRTIAKMRYGAANKFEILWWKYTAKFFLRHSPINDVARCL